MSQAPTRELPEEDRVASPSASGGELGPGAMLGRFVVRGRLGGGGMGVVHVADDPDLGRSVAIKLIRADEDRPGLRARLLREAQAMARLDHPHVVRVHEIGETGTSLYIVMELVDGETLTSWLTAPRAWQEIVAAFRQAGLGLAAIHRAGMVHRDVKPDNILVDRAGRVRVADLGLVRAMAPDVTPAMAASLTRTGIAMGTLGYMAPEQQRGEKVDARADQYSFCVALREALRDKRAPRRIELAIARGLAPEPAARFASMDELLAALAPRRARRRLALGVIVVLAIGAVALLVANRSPGSSSSPSRTLALAPDGPAAAITVDARSPDAGSDAATTEDVGSRRAPHATPPPTAPAAPISNREALRTAIGDLDYRGFALADLDADVAGTQKQFEDDLATRTAAGETATTGILIARVMIGHVARRRGDCSTAMRRYDEALATPVDIRPVNRERTSNFLWLGRAHLGRALCRLDAGDLGNNASDLKNAYMIGWGGGGKSQLAEIQLVEGILRYERGDLDAARSILHAVALHGDARVNRALDAWLVAVDWTLR